MNVLLISSSLEGGAGGATARLHGGLRRLGVASRLVVGQAPPDVSPQDAIVVPRSSLALALAGLNSFPLGLYPNRDKAEPFSVQAAPDGFSSMIGRLHADLVNLHYICANYIRIETLARLRGPLVWTLHDMWAFTGGCHHNTACRRHTRKCGGCPALAARGAWDLSRWIWRRKAKAYRNLDLSIVTPSAWLAACARASSLFGSRRIEVIPNGIDTDLYRPIDRRIARSLLGLPQDELIVLFAAWGNTRIKGFHLLMPALQKLRQSGRRFILAVAGFARPADYPEHPVETRFLGRLNEPLTMALAYSAADIYTAASMHENFPTAVMEAMACATPCVAFDVEGMPELIEHGWTGLLAHPFDVDDLAAKLAVLIDNEHVRRQMSQAARDTARQRFTNELCARRYQALFEDILLSRRRHTEE